MTLPPSFWRAFSSELMIEFVLLLAPASLAGASFPLAVRMVVRDPALAGFGVGLLAALNTAGGIVGALAVGFAVLPAFGLDATVRIVTGIGLAIGVAAWLALEPRGAAAARLAAAALAAVAWLGIPALTGTRLPADFLADPGELADYREGRVSNLAIVRRGDVEELQIDRWWQGENRKNHQFMAAHLPMLIHPEPRRVLVVGVGAGQTPGRFLMYEELDRLECVDIEPAIFDFIRPHFDSRWMQDDRVALIHADGRNHLMHTAAHYDVVSLEVGQLFRPGVATLYTTDFYRRVSERLEPGGLCAQFVPTPFLGVDQFRSVVRAFVDVFPQSALWYNTSELLLVGVNGAPVEIDLDRLERLVTDDEIGADLRYSYWGGAEHWLVRPEVLLGGYLCGPSGLAQIAAGAAALVDDRPRLEYATSHVDPLARREIPIVDLIRRHLDPVREVVRGELGPETLRAIDEMRDRNLGDVAAAANLRLVELDRSPLGTDRAVALLREALERNPASFACHRRLADVLVAAGRLAEAYPSFLAAVELRPDDVWSRRGLAFLLLRAGRVDEAIPHLRVALEHEPDDATTHNYLGAALAERGDLAEAIRHFESAARLAPGDTEIEANLARARRAGSGSP